MLTAIDHIVVVVPDLASATARFRDLGFTVVPGGRHLVGTHNALIALQDGAYMELIAFLDPPTPQNHRWWGPLQRGGGLVDFCAATGDFAAGVETMRGSGIGIGEVRAQSRTRPDGYTLRWTLAIPPEERRGLVPFLIMDDTPRRERVPGATTHANQVTGLDRITIAVPDAGDLRHLYQGLLGQAGVEERRDDLGAAGCRFSVGAHDVEILAPARAASLLDPVLAQRGPGPYAVTLTTRTGGSRVLDHRATSFTAASLS